MIKCLLTLIPKINEEMDPEEISQFYLRPIVKYNFHKST